MTAEKLLPCPFCGSEGLVSAYPYDRPEMYMVECSKCECAVGKEYDNCAMPDFQYGEEAQAIAAWNTRPADPRIEAAEKMAEALREAVAWGDRMAAKGNPPMQTWVVPSRAALSTYAKAKEPK